MQRITNVLQLVLRRVDSLKFPAGNRGRLRVIYYHRVLPEADPILADGTVARVFDVHMSVLRRQFNVLALDDAVSLLKRGELPERAVAVTFDDGYSDNFTVALPILQRWGLPATFFVATGFLDGGCMWNDRLIEAVRQIRGSAIDLRPLGLGESIEVTTPDQRRHLIGTVIGQMKYLDPVERMRKVDEFVGHVGAGVPKDMMMTSANVRELARAGMQIGGHTRTHPILARLSDDEAREEIAGCKRELEAITGKTVDLFAYPNGKPDQDYGHRDVRLVKEAGYVAAFTTAPGAAIMSGDMFQLPRFGSWDATPTRFNVRLMIADAGPGNRVTHSG